MTNQTAVASPALPLVHSARYGACTPELLRLLLGTEANR